MREAPACDDDLTELVARVPHGTMSPVTGHSAAAAADSQLPASTSRNRHAPRNLQPRYNRNVCVYDYRE